MTDLLWRPAARAEGHVVACIGETMVALAPTDGIALEQTTCLALDVAGAESNVAMYLADHAVRSRWVSRLGDDVFGRRVLHRVRAAGVDVTAVQTDPDRPTGLLVKDPDAAGTRVSYYRRGSAASAMGPDMLASPALRAATLWHLTGITPALSDSCRELAMAAFCDKPADRPATSFDVNYRPSLWREPPRELLRTLAQAADVVFVGLDEAQSLWGEELREATDVRAYLPDPRILIVKDGATAATAFCADTSVTVPSLKVDIVESVGAGDAFAAGFLAGLLKGQSAERCLQTGHVTAAAALRVTSDHGPLPDPGEYRRLLERSPAPQVNALAQGEVTCDPQSVAAGALGQ
ncbi:2-dehydro-3-deoxygluconokinase [Streptacidiphilus sp. BW17]|uniref:sugar kinase n=1 Tax=Streptacidiphilus sp. BW17 TaxID=3156274 RepID=UPI003514F915